MVDATIYFLHLMITFYFRHDLWHFFGGAGLFFIFMFILTIDEDIRYKERSKIAVF